MSYLYQKVDHLASWLYYSSNPGANTGAFIAIYMHCKNSSVFRTLCCHNMDTFSVQWTQLFTVTKPIH